jgi:hypothetical protein
MTRFSSRICWFSVASAALFTHPSQKKSRLRKPKVSSASMLTSGASSTISPRTRITECDKTLNSGSLQEGRRDWCAAGTTPLLKRSAVGAGSQGEAKEYIGCAPPRSQGMASGWKPADDAAAKKDK